MENKNLLVLDLITSARLALATAHEIARVTQGDKPSRVILFEKTKEAADLLAAASTDYWAAYNEE